MKHVVMHCLIFCRFVGSAWSDPRKVKDGLESKKSKSCWIDYDNNASLAKQGLFHVCVLFFVFRFSVVPITRTRSVLPTLCLNDLNVLLMSYQSRTVSFVRLVGDFVLFYAIIHSLARSLAR
jgi:hypothetical protein